MLYNLIVYLLSFISVILNVAHLLRKHFSHLFLHFAIQVVEMTEFCCEVFRSIAIVNLNPFLSSWRDIDVNKQQGCKSILLQLIRRSLLR